MKAGLYLRISHDATGEGLGVTRQREDCTDLANQLGWDIVDTYIDNDTSAYSRRPRPEYQRMLREIEGGRIDAVVAWHADRLYRKVTDLAGLIDIARAHNTQIATVKAGHIDLTTPTGRLVAGLLAQVAVYEVDHKTERWSRSWRQHREAGAIATNGTRLFGYTRDGQLELAEAEVVRQMAADVLAGVPLAALSRQLQERGIVGTRGSAWRPTSIRQYLLNPRIAGWSTLGREIVGEGQWEPILDRETWDVLRAMLQSRTAPTPVRVSLLNGLIFCGRCKSRLITSSRSDSQQVRRRIYRCDRRPGINGCGGVAGDADRIEDIVEGYAERRLNDPRTRARIEAARSHPAGTHVELASIEVRISELEAQLEEPGVPVATLLRAIDRAKARQERLLKSLATKTGAPLPARGSPWPEDLQVRRGLVDLVVARVELMPATKPSRLGFDQDRVDITRK